MESIDVLLVESNPADVRLVREQFSEAGIEGSIRAVDDGAEAVDAVVGGELHPDVVLLNQNPPEADLESMLAELAGASPPVVVLTATETEQAVLDSNGIDPDGYLTKPPNPDEVVEFLR